MAKTETLHIRLDPGVKDAVEDMLHSLGMTTSEAVNIFFHQILLHQGLPFAVKRPNAETLAAMEEVEAGAGLLGPYHSAREVMEELNA